ncbi:nucleotidyltransferase domain-containing protein [Bdellovibrionota bacterium FG-1]
MTNTTLLDKDPILAEIVQRLVKEFNPTRVFLFGSRARGDAGEGSDYDLLVVMAQIKVPGYQLAQKAHRSTLQGIPAPVDIVIITTIEFEENKTIIGTLPELVLHEGKELYAA